MRYAMREIVRLISMSFRDCTAILQGESELR
jgi:hypothetical protein